MKTEYPDAPRAGEQDPEGLRAFVRSRQVGPSDAALDRVAKRLATAGVLSPTRKPASDRPSVNGKVAYYKAGLLAAAVAGVLAVSWDRAERPFAGTNEQAPSMTAQSPAPEVVSPASELPVAQVAQVAVAPEPDRPAAVVSVDQLPSAPPLARGISSTPAAAKSTKSPAGGAEAAPSATELELVQRAQAALASDPNRALTLTNEHAVTYPKGELVQEREVTAVEALARLGRNEEASRRALAFVRRFPQTPYAARLEMAIGRPLPAPSGASTPEASARSLSTATP
ncbi:MAG: hypothetical protein BGO98_32205 [Myxococcales bacterium 68-20]|nr:hypothetical protein [Myxococcales bacterium]OJY18405.1 MAG: hypothetical protein BGO98_32205 [Myxococcales bacterium 68-20]